MRNTFNLMLMMMAIFDSGYLIFSILESMRKSFNLITKVHMYLFPYLLFPGQSIMMSASIYMTVAIAMERYVAVHYPLDYRQTMNDVGAMKMRLLKYVVPVVLLSISFNIPKFFEIEIREEPSDSNATVVYHLDISSLRSNPEYTVYYSNWARLIVLGVVPLVLLVYFNYKIYKDIKFRQCYPSRPQSSPRNCICNINTNVDAAGNNDTIQRCNCSTAVVQQSSSFQLQSLRRKQEDKLAIIFMAIVLVFLICHFPRVFLNLHEMVVIKQALFCANEGKLSFELWIKVVGYISHFFLVVNCSGNCIVYALLSSKFRDQANFRYKSAKDFFIKYIEARQMRRAAQTRPESEEGQPMVEMRTTRNNPPLVVVDDPFLAKLRLNVETHTI